MHIKKFINLKRKKILVNPVQEIKHLLPLLKIPNFLYELVLVGLSFFILFFNFFFQNPSLSKQKLRDPKMYLKI